MLYQNSAAPGDVKKFQVMIDGKDVSDSVTMADVYMDIFNPTWTAQIFFDDTANLLMSLPIKTGSKITITVETALGMEGDGEKEYRMTVYRIGDKRLISHMQQQYTVFAAHKDLIKSQKTRVRRSFNNKKPDQIVQQLISEELGGAVDAPKPADNNLSLIVPNWTPFNAASWMCKVATYNNAADYCFFMADDGKYSFKSFEEMFSSDDEKKDLTFYQKPASIREGGDYPDDFTVQVLRYNWEHFDGASAQSSGMYSSTTVSFDLIGKKWEKKVFTFGEDTPADAEGKNFEDVMGGEEANISFTPKHAEMFQSPSVVDYTDQWIGSRKSSIQKMDMEKLVVQIAGAAKSWEWLGKNVQVDLPSQTDMEDEKLDKHRKGRFVIVAMCQHIGKDSYVTNVEFVKKRLEKGN